MEQTIVINPDGSMEFIYADDLRDLIDEGNATIHRVSNVEPGIDGFWYAQMINGPILGPFKYRQDALNAEIDYINEEMLNGSKKS